MIRGLTCRADRTPQGRWLSLLSLLWATRALAQDAGVALETTVSEERHAVPEERASSVVRQADFERRLPRSAPDALRFEPGVFVQQTAHGQASVYVRGLTGQQTVLLFDGIRLNTSTWRQGPNQYFFTLDAASTETLEVLRGGSSTRFGSDALGGLAGKRGRRNEPERALSAPASRRKEWGWGAGMHDGSRRQVRCTRR